MGNGPPNPSISDADLLKLSFEWCKHIATLSTGSTLLMVTFLEKLNKQPDCKILLPIALVSFVAATLGTLGVQLDLMLNGRAGGSALGTWSAPLSLVAFFVGIVALTAFGLVNLV